jgi:hypothetical protein
MSGLLTSEMSAYKAGYDNMIHLKWEVYNENILSKTRTGAGNEDTRGNFAGSKRANSLDGSSGDIGHNRQADEAVEKKI